ncbi:FAD-dependent oxidoreductase [Streptomyces sp. NPDC003077]|uniref:FAD-dependent oxidoreductase n=1 Tax=Streptomyces sp. NPDC003077 TaxID=3154443 RepID=UPI0033A9A92A
MTNDVVVVGGGVIGLTAAVTLAEDGHGVRVISRDPAADTTSAVAGGLCWPYRIQPEARALAWFVRSFQAFARLAERAEETGVRMAEGTMVDTGDWDPDAWHETIREPRQDPGTVPNPRRATAAELPAGYESGWRARTPLVDMPVYLRYLERRLVAAGGTVERRPVRSLEEEGRSAGAVVNCSGLGARELAPDRTVHPVQGQVVVVENPGIEEWFAAPGSRSAILTSVLPQPYGLVLGGTARAHVWSRRPEPAIAEAIVDRCARAFPQLAGARILAHKVGLRPARPTVRLTSEPLANGVPCVHNYGHGGAGVTVSWGCAQEVAELLRGVGEG